MYDDLESLYQEEQQRGTATKLHGTWPDAAVTGNGAYLVVPAPTPS